MSIDSLFFSFGGCKFLQFLFVILLFLYVLVSVFIMKGWGVLFFFELGIDFLGWRILKAVIPLGSNYFFVDSGLCLPGIFLLFLFFSIIMTSVKYSFHFALSA